MKKNKKLSRTERLEISILIKKGYSMRAIAESLGRSPNTISYEIRKNSVKGVYDPKKANAKVRVRRHDAKFQRSKIQENDDLRKYIIQKLKKHWNPDEISGRMQEEKKSVYVSKTAIYEWLYNAFGQKYCKFCILIGITERKEKRK